MSDESIVFGDISTWIIGFHHPVFLGCLVFRKIPISKIPSYDFLCKWHRFGRKYDYY